jgi:hypothetical protein
MADITPSALKALKGCAGLLDEMVAADLIPENMRAKAKRLLRRTEA